MTIYTITTSNWNNAAFWNAISEIGPGQTLDFSGLPVTFDLDFYPDDNRLVISDGSTAFTVGDNSYTGTPDATLSGSTLIEYFTTIIGTQGEDLIDGTSGSDILDGGDGNDDIIGYGGADELYGGFGDDILTGGGGADILQGEEGNDTIFAGSGDDTINVSENAGIDQINGGESAGDSDVLHFFGSAPVAISFTDLESGSYAFNGGGGASGTFTNIESVVGASGQDTLDLSALTGPITVTYTDEFDGTISNGTNTISFSSFEIFILPDQADVIDASASWDGVFGDNPGVEIDARGGDDSILGGNGADTLLGGTGNDTLDGAYGDDNLLGGTGQDSLIGGSGNDIIDGGADADFIDGGIEGDRLSGGTGDDTINGGDGDDTIGSVYGTESGGDDLIFGGAGNDSIYIGNWQDTVYGGDDADFIYSLGSERGKTVFGGEGGIDDDTLSWSTENDLGDSVDDTFSTDEAGSAQIRGQTVTFPKSRISKVRRYTIPLTPLRPQVA